MQLFKETFSFRSPINIDNGYFNQPLSKDTESSIEVWINLNEQNEIEGGFEWIIDEFGIVEGGGLWFDGKELTDYDGVFELPTQLIEFLENKGFNMDYAKN